LLFMRVSPVIPYGQHYARDAAARARVERTPFLGYLLREEWDSRLQRQATDHSTDDADSEPLFFHRPFSLRPRTAPNTSQRALTRVRRRRDLLLLVVIDCVVLAETIRPKKNLDNVPAARR
jgi:hypothetical protein